MVLVLDKLSGVPAVLGGTFIDVAGAVQVPGGRPGVGSSLSQLQSGEDLLESQSGALDLRLDTEDGRGHDLQSNKVALIGFWMNQLYQCSRNFANIKYYKIAIKCGVEFGKKNFMLKCVFSFMILKF